MLIRPVEEEEESGGEYSGPRVWRMHAGVGGRVGFRNFGRPRYVEAFGDVPVEVEVREDPDGEYFGWLAVEGEAPVMIQPHPGLYSMQFAYGPEAEEKAGRGVTLKLRVNRLGQLPEEG